jgi:hypothetical protein
MGALAPALRTSAGRRRLDLLAMTAAAMLGWSPILRGTSAFSCPSSPARRRIILLTPDRTSPGAHSHPTLREPFAVT